MGSNNAKATDLAIVVGNAIIDSDYVSISEDTVTIKQEILQQLQAGTYQFSVVFDDEKMTTVDDMITVNIFNSHPTVSEDTEAGNGETESEGSEAANAAEEGA